MNNLGINRKPTKLENKNEKKHNYMDNSSDKVRK